MASFVFLLSLWDKGLITLFFMPIINQIWLHYRSSAKKHAIGIQRKYEVKIISRWQTRLYNDLHTKGRLIWEQNNRTSYRWRLPCSIFRCSCRQYALSNFVCKSYIVMKEKRDPSVGTIRTDWHYVKVGC